MSKLNSWLWRACAELGLPIELDFVVAIPNVSEVRAIARIPNLGAPKGMLIFSSYDAIRHLDKQLQAAGFGFSVLDEPRLDEEFDLESFTEMFADWGWSGELGKRPQWMA